MEIKYQLTYDDFLEALTEHYKRVAKQRKPVVRRMGRVFWTVELILLTAIGLALWVNFRRAGAPIVSLAALIGNTAGSVSRRGAVDRHIFCSGAYYIGEPKAAPRESYFDDRDPLGHRRRSDSVFSRSRIPPGAGRSLSCARARDFWLLKSHWLDHAFGVRRAFCSCHCKAGAKVVEAAAKSRPAQNCFFSPGRVFCSRRILAARSCLGGG